MERSFVNAGGEITVPEDANATGIIIPWSAELGFRLLSVGDGLCSLRLPWRPDLSGSNGGIASGAIASLIDHACGAAVMSRLERVSISTLNLKIDHIRLPTARSPVTAWAHCYRVSEIMTFVRAEVWDTDPAEVFAAAQGVFSINRGVAA
ncbi:MULTISPECIES: PaaI family thioesterase [Sphingomonadales]|uniref:PaaI family thioesterase n=1 Tax=Sphingomonadales TaxID=204457 RepID=UPI00105BEB07|nr:MULTISPECIES: PaaI family thioesterase [Sphingomonadaceae]MBN2972879.1 PaaI family thioesterase [Roseomonas aeriglobus]MBY0300149.1 PaaI family thioesterase [Sphingomonas ginsenosidimutans]MDV3480917.1 PaaI family thioesterase [Sphingobium yanoikuyae]HUD91121.1 PaaI family thioesterase [Sphingobium sp.]